MKKDISNITNKIKGLELFARQGKEMFAQFELQCFSISQDLETLHTPGPPSGTRPLKTAKALIKKMGSIATIQA